MKYNLIAMLVGLMVLSAAAFASDINVSADVTGQGIGDSLIIWQNGSVVNQIDPGTSFTVFASVIDPVYNLELSMYNSNDVNDSNITVDHVTVTPVRGSQNGCDDNAVMDKYCFTVDANMWNTMFVDGNTNIFIDNNNTAKEFVNAYVTNPVVGYLQSATSANYFGLQNSQNNAIVTNDLKNYITTSNTGNKSLKMSLDGTNLMDMQGNSIPRWNQKWLQWDDSSNANTLNNTGNFDVNRLGYSNTYLWLDIGDVPRGIYNGVLTFNGQAA